MIWIGRDANTLDIDYSADTDTDNGNRCPGDIITDRA